MQEALRARHSGERRKIAMTEFSRIVAVELRPADKVIDVEAGPAERAALAARFGLLSLEHLSANGTLHVFEGGRAARLEASVSADVVQSCVVTLEPVASHIEEQLSVLYARTDSVGSARGAAKEIQVRLDDDEEPEPIPDAGIDVGEAVAECLGLALDPYPRAAEADAALESLGIAPPDKEHNSPFAALEKLKKENES